MKQHQEQVGGSASCSRTLPHGYKGWGSNSQHQGCETTTLPEPCLPHKVPVYFYELFCGAAALRQIGGPKCLCLHLCHADSCSSYAAQLVFETLQLLPPHPHNGVPTIYVTQNAPITLPDTLNHLILFRKCCFPPHLSISIIHESGSKRRNKDNVKLCFPHCCDFDGNPYTVIEWICTKR